jgi:hypothetical protein
MGLLSDRHYLTPLFAPESVALIGASERLGSVGAVLVSNVRAAGFRGALFAVNPKYRAVQEVPCVPSIAKLPQRVDLAVIATPCRDRAGHHRAMRRRGRACSGHHQRRIFRSRESAVRGSIARCSKRRGGTACACWGRIAWACCGPTSA